MTTPPKDFKPIVAPGVEVDNYHFNEDGTGWADLRGWQNKATIDRVPMTKEQVDVFRGTNTDGAFVDKHLLRPYKAPKTPAAMGYEFLGNLGQKAMDFGHQSYGNKALLYGGLAGLAGMGYGAATGDGGIGSRLGRGLKWGAGAVGGLGLGALLYHLIQKYTSHNLAPQWNSGMGKTASFQDISSFISADASLSFSEKADLLRMVRNLSPGDKAELSDLLLTAGGAGAGAIIAKFLGAKGILGMGLGALLGGALGWSFGGPSAPRLTASGQLSSYNF